MLQNTVAFQRDPTKVVRRIWGDFESWAAEQRANLEKECGSLDSKLCPPPLRSLSKRGSESHKTTEVRALQDKYIFAVREEWDKRLRAHKLKDSDWGFMTPQEQERVFIVLGGDLDESSPATAGAVMLASQRPLPSNSLIPTPSLTSPTQPLLIEASTTTAPIPIPALTMVVGCPAPVLSSTARNLNSSSTSSYSFVDPSDFTTDDELYDAVSSYITLPTDESDNDEPIPIKDPELWGISNHETLVSGSLDHTAFHNRSSSSRLSNVQFEKNRSPTRCPSDTNKVVKPRLRGPSYVGPLLSDPDETSGDEIDFEHFKMETRIRMIWEFHYAAAQADVRLAVNIYNDRVMKTSSKAGDAQKVAEHERRMLKMQVEKENERKAIVTAERKKRRAELRRRAALRETEKDVNAADGDGTQPKWENFFDSRLARINFDECGRVIHGVGESGSTEHKVQSEIGAEGSLFPTDIQVKVNNMPSRLPAGKAPTSKLSFPTHNSPWQANSVPLPAETSTSASPTSSPSFFPGKKVTEAEGLFESIPGSFPTSSSSGWTTRKLVGVSKLAQVETASFFPPNVSDQSTRDSSFLSLSPKKLIKQRLMNPKKEHALQGVLKSTVTDFPTAPMCTSELASLKNMPSKLTQVEEEVPSTPRPRPLSTRLKRSGYVPDATATPRMALQRLGPMSGSMATEMEEESLWQRAQRLGKMPTGQAPAGRSAVVEEPEEVAWQSGIRQKEHQVVLGSPQMKSMLATEEVEASIWQRTMKGKMSTSLASMGIPNPGTPAAEERDGETQLQRMMRLGSNVMNINSNGGGALSPKMSQANSPDEESPWERMQRLKNRERYSAQAPTSTSPPENKNPRQKIQLLKTHGNLETGAVEQANAFPSTEPADETPWQRISRLKAQGVEVTPSVGNFGPGVIHLPTANTISGKDFRSVPEGVVHSVSGSPCDLSWSQNKIKSGPLRQSAWNTSLQQKQRKVVMNDTKARKGEEPVTKRVTIEDVSDEDRPYELPGRWGPDEQFPSDSRMILDIAEPKPSVPPTMFENIFQYGENVDEHEEDEYDTGLSSSVPTPSTAPTSPPSDDALDEEWYVSAMAEMGKGNWENILKTGGPPSQATGAASLRQTHLTAQPHPHSARWGPPAVTHTKGGSLLSQTIDSAKLISALEAVDEKPNVAAVCASPPEPVVAALGTGHTVSAIARAHIMGNKNDPTTKPSPTTATKGKGKKGKGRR